MPYISITGLQLRRKIYLVQFWWHAIRSMIQVRKAPGNISADAKTINGVHHTVSVWSDEEAMRHYLVTGAHLSAMKSFHSIATGKTLGYTADHAPSWDEVHILWKEKGVELGARKHGSL